MAAEMSLATESVWFDKFRHEDAERDFYERMAKGSSAGSGSVISEIMKAREHIKSSLAAVENAASSMAASPRAPEFNNRLHQLEKENMVLKKVTDDLRSLVLSLETRVKALEAAPAAPAAAPAAPAAAPAAPAPATSEAPAEDDDEVDLFADEEDDAEADRIKAERVAAYQAKKSKKPVLIAKSSILLDVKPWDDETDMAEMEKVVRAIESDGLLWGASKLVPLAYGIKKLQICCVIEDDKISVDWLQETIQENEELVQSVDIAAFNKI